MTSDPICGRCGKPAQGYALINDVRYCHPDTDDNVDEPTCYQAESYERTCPADLRRFLEATAARRSRPRT